MTTAASRATIWVSAWRVMRNRRTAMLGPGVNPPFGFLTGLFLQPASCRPPTANPTRSGVAPGRRRNTWRHKAVNWLGYRSTRRAAALAALLPVLLLSSTPLLALKAPGQNRPSVEPAQPSPPPAGESKTEPESENAVTKPAPPRATNGGFVPSERIKADSVVSFPVDI